MFKNTRSAFLIIKDSLQVFNKYPKMIMPILGVWLVYAPTIIYLKHHLDWGQYSLNQAIGIVFLTILGFATLLTFSCGMVCEFIKQIETGEEVSSSKALAHFASRSIFSLIPLAICWAVIWFGLAVIQALLSKAKKSSSNSSGSFSESAVRDLNDSGSSFAFHLIQKQFRMLIFLVVPSIVWHERGFFSSLEKCQSIYRRHFTVFQTGFVLSEVVATVVFFPIGLLLAFSQSKNGNPPLVQFPEYVWTCALIFTAFAWSYSIFIEQLFCAELYLWNHKWEEKRALLPEEERYKILKLHDVERPSLLDDVHDLKAS